MKLFSKVLCILSVLVLCVPFFCLSVSADSSSSGSFGNVDMILPPYYGIETFEPNEDGSGFKIAAEDLSSDGQPLYLEKNRIDRVDQMDPYFLFTYCIDVQYRKNLISFNTNAEYYYFTYFFDKVKNKDNGDSTTTRACYTYISTTPFHFEVYDSNSYYLEGDNSQCTGAAFSIKIIDGVTEYVYPSDIVDGLHRFDKNMVSNKASESVEGSYHCYTNCNIDTSMFDSDENLVKGISSLNKTPESGFEEDIDVKLTPEFGYDMDRVFDTTTGRNDYFKLEVTNNSDTPIQFCASIVDGTFKDSYENNSGSSSSGSFGDTTDSDSTNDSGTINPNSDHNGYNLIETSHWNYITQTSYYYPNYKLDDGLLFDDIIISSEYRMGNYYFVYLKPGEHFEDCIYWENVNIVANHEYTFVVQAFPSSLDYATDIFYYTLDNKKIYPYITNTVTALDFAGVSFLEDFFGFDYDEYEFGPDDIFSYAISSTVDISVNKAFYKYALSLDDVRTCFCQPFSVKTIPEFTTEVSGGNSKITSGWSDTQAQANNPYYRNDNATGNIIPVDNYSEFKGNSLNGFDYDINNASVDDVMGYLDYSKNFFSLIGATLNTFPTFIWGLIAFGLSAFVVIAIVKWIIT